MTTVIALDIGLDAIRKECKFFNGWLERIASLSKTHSYSWRGYSSHEL
jgi:hypothetical protein